MLRLCRLAVSLLAVAGVSAACAASVPAATWKKIAAPVIKGQTDDITVNEGTLADGTYWATIALASGSGDIVFRVLKARFGAACTKWAKNNGVTDACMDDYNVESYPDAYASLDNRAEVSVAKPDGPGTNYSINVDRLKALMHGEMAQSDKVPAGYSWVPFPFVVTVTNGYVTTAAQYWVP